MHKNVKTNLTNLFVYFAISAILYQYIRILFYVYIGTCLFTIIASGLVVRFTSDTYFMLIKKFGIETRPSIKSWVLGVVLYVAGTGLGVTICLFMEVIRK